MSQVLSKALYTHEIACIRPYNRDFLGAPVVKKPLSKARNSGSILVMELRSYVLHGQGYIKNT